jgi:translocator protein
MSHWKSLAIFLVLVALAASMGAIVKPDAWFAVLAKPSFNPPNWIFAPVWTLLYILMAIAAWRVYRVVGIDSSIVLWIVQLILNAAWSPLFFGAHRISFALADIVVLLAFIVATTILFFRRDRVAGSLMVPYVAWVAFATLLNFTIWQLNP